MAGERDELGDVDALVAHALDVLHDVQECGHDAQVAGDGGLQREQGEDALVDLQVAPVDAVVVGDHHGRELDVLVLERLEHAVELLDDEVEAAEGAGLELQQLLLKVLAGGAPGGGERPGRTDPAGGPTAGSRGAGRGGVSRTFR